MIEVHFKDIRNKILQEVSLTQNCICIAVAWFTEEQIYESILQLLDKNIQVNLLLNKDYINCGKNSLDLERFVEKKGNLYYADEDVLLHHKFCIIDDVKVITGSYNWTYFAEMGNYENIVVISDKYIVSSYKNEFDFLISDLLKIDVFIPLEPDDSQPDSVKEYVEKDRFYKQRKIEQEYINQYRYKILKLTKTDLIKTVSGTVVFIKGVLDSGDEIQDILSTCDPSTSHLHLYVNFENKEDIIKLQQYYKKGKIEYVYAWLNRNYDQLPVEYYLRLKNGALSEYINTSLDIFCACDPMGKPQESPMIKAYALYQMNINREKYYPINNNFLSIDFPNDHPRSSKVFFAGAMGVVSFNILSLLSSDLTENKSY